MIERKKKEKQEKAGLKCVFEKHGARCSLLGTMSPHTGQEPRFYCAYHFDVVTRSSDLNSYHKFSEWLTEYLNQYKVSIHGAAQFDRKGNITEFKGNAFFRYEPKKLWLMMGNKPS